MRLTAIALVLGLGACSSVSLAGLAQLYALSPLASDPEGIAVALTLPEGVQLQPGMAKFSITASTDGGDKTSNATYVLVPSPGTDGSTVYQFAQADLDKVRAQQKLIGGWEEADPRGTSGSIGVSVGGCAVGDGPSEDAVMSISMRNSADSAFYTLVKNASWQDALGEAKLKKLDPC